MMNKSISSLTRKKIRYRSGVAITIVLIVGLLAVGGVGTGTVFAQQADTADAGAEATTQQDGAEAVVIPSLPSTTVNIRSGPSTAYDVVRAVLAGSDITVLGQDSTGSWLWVQLPDGTEGWIARFLTNYAADAPIAAIPPLAGPATTADTEADQATQATTEAQATAETDYTATVVTGVASGLVNVRSGPSTEYNIIDTVMAGSPVTVLGQDATSTWLSVQLDDGTRGWIARYLTDFATAVQTVTAPPLAAPATGLLQTDNIAVIETAAIGGRVNIRSGPSTAYNILRTVPSGTQVTVLGQDTTSTWLRVQLNDGTLGWVARYLTDFTTAVQTVTAPPLAAPATTPIQTDNVAIIQTGAAGGFVNVRSGPSTAYSILRTVPSSTQVTVLGQDPTSTWLSVQLNDGTQGWVARFLTDFTIAVQTVAAPPLAPPATTPSDTALDSATILPTQPNAALNVRSDPSITNNIITTVPSGTEAMVLGQDATGNWLYVRFGDGTEGWIARSLTDFTTAVQTISASVAPSQQPPLAPPAAALNMVPATEEIEPGVFALPGQPGELVNPPVEDALASNQMILSEGEVEWFTFSHAGDTEVVQIWMEVEPNDGAGFAVYDEETARAIMAGASLEAEDITAIGHGTPNPNEPGDLFWRGAFEEHGQYFVLVTHGTTGDVAYDIYGSGPGFSTP